MGGKLSGNKLRETKKNARVTAMQKKWAAATSSFMNGKEGRRVFRGSDLGDRGQPCNVLRAAIRKQKEDGEGFVLYLDGTTRVSDLRAIINREPNASAAFFDTPSPRKDDGFHVLFKSLGWYSLENDPPGFFSYPLLSYLFYRSVPNSANAHYLFILHEGGTVPSKESLGLIEDRILGAPQLSVIFANTKST